MRKQTKIVAVASAAALLAIGASMTSFAATGWVEEDGQWYFYDKDGNTVEDEWKKSGDNWYWLDSEDGGAMAADKLVEDGDNLYYVDSNGVMVKNTWVKVVNDDQDDDDEAEYDYYYMQANGKAYKTNTNATKFKTIDGKRYAFDSDGKMLWGWVNANAERLTDEDDWATNGVYYLGSWEDGSMKTGWQYITVHDALEDDDMDHWFWFKSNGQKFADDRSNTKYDNFKTKKLNGRTYGFDDRGVMVYQWNVASNSNQASASGWSYFSSPEDGARYTKGWFKVIAPDEDSTFTDNVSNAGSFDQSNASDEEEKWYYADGDGLLYTNAIKKIKGKYYAFGTEGQMLNGLVFISVDPTNGAIDFVYDDGVDSDDLDDIIADTATGCSDPNAGLYYFGNDADHDGAMKTGTVTVNVDGDSQNFFFSKTGGVEGKGRGVTGVDDKKYIYKYGLRIKASNDDKYKVVYASGEVGTSGVTVKKIDSLDLRNNAMNGGYITNKDSERVYYSGTMANHGDIAGYFLVNTSGTIQKTKTAAKDGNDWYFYVKNKQIRMYTNNKTIKGLNASNRTLENWDGTGATIGNGYVDTEIGE